MRARLPAGLICAIAVGGAAGTVLRALIAQEMPPPPSGFPWDIFVVNVSGCAILGFVVVAALERSSPSVLVRPLMGTGFCGGLTTFSTFVVETDLLIKDGAVLTAVAYVLASLAAGVLAARIGVEAARTAWSRRRV